ncbi:MAG: hypothetical protein KAT00_05730 [Planctomycetes bacterium]|nr:hypothetical protein [Planctomycetota bacterium]
MRRRSTFVSAYAEGYYLAPTEAEWDDLLAITAELEETLMGCADILAALEGIQSAVACLCAKARTQPHYTPVTQDIVNWYVDDGQARHDDPYPATTVADANRCAIAQLTYYVAHNWLTSWVIPVQDLASDILIPLVMAAVVLACGPAIFTIPTGVLLAAIFATFEVWEEGEQTNVVNTLVANKDEIICAVYDGLLTTAADAAAAAKTIIDGTSLAPLDKACLGLLTAPWAIAMAKAAWTEQTAWATSNVQVGYCTVCDALLEGVEFTFTWPPCPGSYHKDGGVCYGSPSVLCFNANIANAHQMHDVQITDYNQLTIQVKYKSKWGSGWTVGHVAVDVWNTSLEQWDAVASLTVTTTEAAGVLNDLSDVFPIAPAQDGGLHRTRITGQAGQADTEPYPMAVEYVRVKYEDI